MIDDFGFLIGRGREERRTLNIERITLKFEGRGRLAARCPEDGLARDAAKPQGLENLKS
jgi:hypothetical protein